MIDAKTMPAAEAPPKSTIVKATLIALAVALVLLFVAVLPAEYGIDPLRTGAVLRLTGISQSDSNAGGRAVAVHTGIYTTQSNGYKISTEDIGLHPNEGVEIKYHMAKGATMVYAWKADGKVQFEFHGEPDKKPKADYFESYALDDKVGQDHFYGSFTAPSTGIHGWFWHNKGKTDVRIHLTTAGFYDAAKMYEPGDPAPEDLMIADPPSEN